MQARSSRPLFINVESFQAASREASVEAIGVVMSLIGAFMPEGAGALVFDPVKTAPALRGRLSPGSAAFHEITPEFLDRMRPDLVRFFTVLADGRWALNPDMFSAIDGNPDAAS